MRKTVIKTIGTAHDTTSANVFFMSCEQMRISCAIDDLGRTLTGWDWGAFASTLLATLLGAALSGLVAWWIVKYERGEQQKVLEQERTERQNRLREEQEDRRAEGLTNAVADLLLALGLYMQELQKYDRAVIAASQAISTSIVVGAKPPKPVKPSVLVPGVQMQLALLRAKDDQVNVILEAQEALWRGDGVNTKVRYRSAGKMVRALSFWVRGKANGTETIDVLKGLPSSELVANPSDPI